MKKLMVVLVALLALGGTVTAYSWWDNLEEQKSETLVVGEGIDLVVSDSVVTPAGKVLVPSEAVLKANDITEIVLTYNVNLDKAANQALDLNVVESNVLVGGVNTYSSLVEFVISTDVTATTVNADVVVVTVTISLGNPVDQTAYNAIINQDITFDLTFTATQQ